MLHLHRGALRSAREIFEDALANADGLGHAPITRQGLRWLGFLAHASGEEEEALRYASAYVDACRGGDQPLEYSGSLVTRGYQYRWMGQHDAAHDDDDASLRLLVPAESTHDSYSLRILGHEVRGELARVSGDYEKAREHALASFPLIEASRDSYLLADAIVCPR
jgi:hypothetical protein